MSDFQIPVEIGTPERIRVAEHQQQDVRFYTHEPTKRKLIIPAAGGYLSADVVVEDSAMGHYKHEKEQAELLGQEPPDHPFALQDHEEWRLAYRVDGGDLQHARARCETWNRWEFRRAVMEEVTGKVRAKHGPPYQIVVGDLQKQEQQT